MAGYGVVVPGMTPAMFGSGAATGFGGFLGRWGDAYRSGMKIGQDQGTANSKYSLDQTENNTKINNARQDDRLRGIEYACEMGDMKACAMLKSYEAQKKNNPAGNPAVLGVSGSVNGIGTKRTAGFWDGASSTNSVGYTPGAGDLDPTAINYYADEDSRMQDINDARNSNINGFM